MTLSSFALRFDVVSTRNRRSRNASVVIHASSTSSTASSSSTSGIPKEVYSRVTQCRHLTQIKMFVTPCRVGPPTRAAFKREHARGTVDAVRPSCTSSSLASSPRRASATRERVVKPRAQHAYVSNRHPRALAPVPTRPSPKDPPVTRRSRAAMPSRVA